MIGSRARRDAEASGSRTVRLLWNLAALCTGLSLWQMAAMLARVFRGAPFPGPFDTAIRLWTLLQGSAFLDHTIFHHTTASLMRWGYGFGLALGLGALYALAASSVIWIEKLTMPVIEVIQTIPGLAWIPVALLLFGLNQTATILMITLTAFPPIAIAGVMGVKSIDRRFILSGRMYGAGPFRLFRTVILPGALAHLLSGVRIGLGSAWRVLVTAEMIVGSGDGLGFSIIQSRWTMDYASAFVCIVIIAAIGLIIERGVFAPLERRTIKRWGMHHER